MRPGQEPPNLDAVAAYLAREPVLNTVSLGLVRRAMASSTLRELTYVAAVTRGGEVVAAAVRSAFPKLAVAATASAADLHELAAVVHRDMPSLPCAIGRPEEVGAFVAGWCGLTGVTGRPGVPQRLHQLAALQVPAGVRGTMRGAEAEDEALVGEWYDAFRREALGEKEAAATAGSAPEGLGSGARFDLWLDPDPVCLVGARPSGEEVWRIGPVYTPPARRRQGYAGALTAAVSRDLLTQGARCCLFTDLRNPTSNHVYRAIGYRPVADIEEYWLAGAENAGD
ncbi:MAG: GNAT family N-acetyltransferase [Candidatus Dormibacteria bacterium]